MIIKKFEPRGFAANNYLVYDEESKEATLIDCAESDEDIFNEIDTLGLNLKYILITHAHFDHILSLSSFKNKYPDVKIVLPENDKVLFDNVNVQHDLFGLEKVSHPEVDVLINEDSELSIGNIKIKPVVTPGHSIGSTCYLIEDNLFSGDTLFKEEIGRCDLLTGSFSDITKSIKEKLFTLGDDIKVFPGHGDNTNIAHEKMYNAYFGEKAIYSV